MDVEVRERHKRPHMLIGISKGLPRELHPRVREELAILPPNAHTDDSAVYATRIEHSRQGNRTDETLRSEDAKSGSPEDRQSKSSRFRQARRIGGFDACGRRGQRPHRATTHHRLGCEERPLRLKQLSPIMEGERRKFPD